MQSQLLDTYKLIIGLTTSGQASVSSQRITGFLCGKQGLNVRLESVWHPTPFQVYRAQPG